MPIAPEPSRDLIAWAAYVLGHHPLYLFGWLTSYWDARDAVQKGKLSADETTPIEASELIEAMRIVSRHVSISPVLAVAVTSDAERFRQACVDVLRAIKSSTLDDEIDWAYEHPPGVDHWRQLVLDIGELFHGEAHLELWRRLGERVGAISISVPTNDDRLLRTLTDLIAGGNYPFLGDLRRAIEKPAAMRPDDTLRAQLCDPIGGDLRVDRFDAYLRRALREGARPEPWIILTKNKLDFLGRTITDLRRARLGILWLLCESPRKPVERWYIKESCNLDCSLENIKSHVTRLKNHLRPVVIARFKDTVSPEYADEAFVHGRRTHLGPYELKLDASYVAVIPPRPDFMVNVPEHSRTLIVRSPR